MVPASRNLMLVKYVRMGPSGRRNGVAGDVRLGDLVGA
jgi:hypothetical protein